MSGPLTITQPRAIVDGLDVAGCLTVSASNVTVRRSRFHSASFCGSNLVAVIAPATGVLLEDVEVDGELSNPKYAAVSGGGGYTCRRCDVHGAGQGFNVWGSAPVVIEDSFVHDLYVREDLGSHNEDVITNGFSAGLTLRHNRLENGYGQTAAISLFADFAAVQKITVDDNLLAGGGYTIYGGSTCPKPYCRQTSGIVVTGNRFSRQFFSKGGQYGPVADFDAAAPGNLWSDNAWSDTAEPVRV
jgi:Right handed beta helix region